MNLTKDRSRGEIILFASVIFGIWLSIWAVVLVSGTLGVAAVLITLIALIIFALRDSDSQ
jgi:nitrate reductase NapE component